MLTSLMVPAHVMKSGHSTSLLQDGAQFPRVVYWAQRMLLEHQDYTILILNPTQLQASTPMYPRYVRPSKLLSALSLDPSLRDCSSLLPKLIPQHKYDNLGTCPA